MKEITILQRTNSEDICFQELIKQLDEYLHNRDKDAHSVCTPYNQTDLIKHVVVMYIGNNAVGCGAFKEYSPDTVEIKRMYVSGEARKQGVGLKILNELETWAKELGYKRCILETGKKLEGAVSLYKKNNYTQIPNYDQYEWIESSICFAKSISN
ncbi:MAG: GNAT family N-acetyltransferase [Bacteroides sp.]|nr:GNAT family N-acetyltransferase [Bacteroides sp.]